MDEEAELERDLILARRLKLAVRVLVYPLLVGGVLLALHVRHVQARANAPYKGRVIVRHSFTGARAFALTDGGRLSWLQISAPETCSSGASFGYRFRVGSNRITQSGTVARVVQDAYSAVVQRLPVTFDVTTATVRVATGRLVVTFAGSSRWREGGRTVVCTADRAPVVLAQSDA